MGNARLVPLLALCVALGVSPSLAAPPATADDRFLAGVASAVLELEFGLSEIDVVVENGRLVLDPAQLQGHDPEAVRAALDGLRGLEVTLDPKAPEPTLQIGAAALPAPRVIDRKDGGWLVTGFLPDHEIFESPLADPRSPGIAAAFQFYSGDDELSTVGGIDVGGSLPVYGWDMAQGLWQIGIQGGVFSIFDLTRSTSELVNADYLVALPLEARYGAVSGRLRVLHESSHLGDEYLLRTGADRVNLSYEAADFLLAYDFLEAFRVYGGGSTLLRRRPRDLDSLGAQAGLEYQSARPVLTAVTYPLAGLDLRAFEESGWEPNISLKGGIELRNGALARTRVQLLAQYFNGRSPHGQFYERSVEYAGFGLRVLF